VFTITKEFSACCSHRLTKVPDGHPCARVHGHNYIVELVLAAENLDARGFVADYRDLDTFKTWLDANLDHRDLNAVGPLAFGIPEFEPTAENLAEAIYTLIVGSWLKTSFGHALVAVRVRETPKTCAEYRP
jgi:6-pyruvoyltetrahydropterin/6-carboxytetrahydropterin synthase